MAIIVFLPGMDGTGTMFAGLVRALGGEFKTIVVSYPEQESLAYEELADLVRAQLPKDEPFILLAESFSGPVALAIAASKPACLSGLILCCTFASNPIPWSRYLRWLILRLPISLRLLGMMSPLLLGDYSSTPLRRELREALSGVSKEVLRERLSAVLAVDYSGYALLTKLPTLYLQATNDRVVPRSAARRLKKLVPHMEVHKIKGPHLLLQAVPSEAAEVIQSFARRIIKSLNPELRRPQELIKRSEIEGLSLPDAVLKITLRNAYSHTGLSPDFVQLLPEASKDELANALLRVGTLMSGAFDAGDAFLAKRMTHGELVEMLARDHPGFAQHSYDDVISYGCYLAK